MIFVVQRSCDLVQYGGYMKDLKKMVDRSQLVLSLTLILFSTNITRLYFSYYLEVELLLLTDEFFGKISSN